MDSPIPKTEMERLLAKQRAIEKRLEDPDVPENEKVRARVRLEETVRAIDAQRTAGTSRRLARW